MHNIAAALRALADVIEKNESEQHSAGVELSPVTVDHADHTESELMIPPLQQKMELLKKASGVQSAFDNSSYCNACDSAECHCDDHCTSCGKTPCVCGDDELDQMRRIAGITVVRNVAGEDNDIEG